MSYNLALDTQFKNNNWNFINCSYKDGCLVSTNKVFGIEQELVLADITRLYFRVNYKPLTIGLKRATIGIQNDDVLEVQQQIPKLNKNRAISIVDDIKQEKIKIHLIFESTEDINEVNIEKPILADLKHLNKSTWIKPLLDKVIHYYNGYVYNNEYHASEIKPTTTDFENLDLDSGKIGSIIKVNSSKEISLSAKFINGNYYLAKLDFEEINNLGNITFKYSSAKSVRYDNEQIYLIFKANDRDQLKLLIESNDVLDYQVNLKHIMILNITKMKLLKNDILLLPFI